MKVFMLAWERIFSCNPFHSKKCVSAANLAICILCDSRDRHEMGVGESVYPVQPNLPSSDDPSV